MYDPRRRYYSIVPEKEKRGPYSPQERRNLRKILLFVLGMTALGVCFGILVFVLPQII